MILFATVVLMGAGAAAFGCYVDAAALTAATQPMIVSLSIMAAAVFVRLNRGMPSLEWKNLEVSERKKLTASVVAVTREYLIILVAHGAAIVALIVAVMVGKNGLTTSHLAETASASVIGGLFTLCVARMGYVVWRDYDIVRLQKQLIDLTGEREASEKAVKMAEAKVSEIKTAGLRSANIPEAKTWE
ncbi:hypothetical protein [Magnetospirillum sp. 64-120]|uniref:hypothetical protein n=1 Tax=Magnetospirillum sp. 64-120 TaxID=1895778 RepID=UPI000927DC93|nr:hypothetical protein [Magnetospirillum sp. 64-120]OJX78578.1 MAG: hypothetical protein BGO92_01655 [Magnetospirillum sp. 64-120]